MSNILGNTHMEAVGTHYMGIGLKNNTEPTKEELETLKQQEEQERLALAARLVELNEGAKPCDNKSLAATGYTIILKPYSKNPYRKLKTSASGLLIGGFDVNRTYKSHESGEQEDAEEFIACGHVISVGPECKYVKVGEDIYYRNTAVPVPFDTRGYYALSEQNVICRVLEKDK